MKARVARATGDSNPPASAVLTGTNGGRVDPNSPAVRLVVAFLVAFALAAGGVVVFADPEELFGRCLYPA